MKRRAARTFPTFIEDEGHFPGRRPFDAHVSIPPWAVFAVMRRAVFVGHIHAAGERNPAIDGDDLAMITKKETPQMTPKGMEQPRFNPQALHLAPERALRGPRAVYVGQDPDSHAPCRRTAQQPQKVPSGGVIS